MRGTRKADSAEPVHSGDLQPEYRFDYLKAKPNRFAAHGPTGPLVVLLDPDVAKVFTTAESVNAVLRAIVTAMPERKRQRSG